MRKLNQDKARNQLARDVARSSYCPTCATRYDAHDSGACVREGIRQFNAALTSTMSNLNRRITEASTRRTTPV